MALMLPQNIAQQDETLVHCFLHQLVVDGCGAVSWRRTPRTTAMAPLTPCGVDGAHFPEYLQIALNGEGAWLIHCVASVQVRPLRDEAGSTAGAAHVLRATQHERAEHGSSEGHVTGMRASLRVSSNKDMWPEDVASFRQILRPTESLQDPDQQHFDRKVPHAGNVVHSNPREGAGKVYGRQSGLWKELHARREEVRELERHRTVPKNWQRA